MDVSLTIDPIIKAINNQNLQTKVLLQQDRGSQYTSKQYLNFCKNNKLILSYNEKGNPYDNAVIESFHANLKKEFMKHNKFKNYKEAFLGISQYIGWYNHKRLHSSIGFVSPIEFEQKISS